MDRLLQKELEVIWVGSKKVQDVIFDEELTLEKLKTSLEKR